MQWVAHLINQKVAISTYRKSSTTIWHPKETAVRNTFKRKWVIFESIKGYGHDIAECDEDESLSDFNGGTLGDPDYQWSDGYTLWWLAVVHHIMKQIFLKGWMHPSVPHFGEITGSNQKYFTFDAVCGLSPSMDDYSLPRPGTLRI